MPDEYHCIASYGHITQIRDSGVFNMGIDVNKNFEIHYEISPNKVATLQKIMDKVEECDSVLIGSDPDREGEGIAFALFSKLKGFNKPIKRITFSEITKAALMKALASPRDLDLSLVAAQECRNVLDKIVGYRVSPMISSILGGKSPLSAGRVQSIMIKIITDREQAIEQFQPETYFTIAVPLSFNDQLFQTKFERKISTKEDADQTKAFLTDPSTTYTVNKVTAKNEKVSPPPPFTTSTLGQYMAKKFKFDADKTAGIAAKLFELGAITYPRSDSPSISEEALSALLKYLKDNKLQTPSKPYNYKSKNQNSQEAHECIRPTNLSVATISGTQDEKTVYSVIRQRFIACQMAPAVYATLKIAIDAKGSKKETLSTSGKTLKSPGFLSYLGVQDNSQINIPDLKKGDICTLSGVITPIEKQTKPPARFNESGLLETLERMEIGRPSTTPALIRKILDRKYVEKIDGIYHPMEMGRKIVNQLSGKFDFMDYDFTVQIEKKLDLIAEGKETYLNTMRTFYDGLSKQISAMYEAEKFDMCSCGGVFKERTSKDGKVFFGCSNYPSCSNIKR
jgi:DNA topoisomerase-1